MENQTRQNPDDTQSSGAASSKQPAADIPTLIKGFHRQILGIKRCANDHLALATDAGQRWLNELKRSVENLAKSLKEHPEEAPQLARQLADSISANLHAAPIMHSNILSQSLLIFGFATLDAFIGRFLAKLYHDAPKLVHALKEKEIKVSALIRRATIEEVLDNLIDREINLHTRSSYEEQFKTLETRHKLKRGWDIEDWPQFIEAAQRRNLLTHCNGVVNWQYLEACKRAKYAVGSSVVIGGTLGVDAAYLRDTLNIIYEVGTVFAHTLWRKAIPSAISKSEEVLNDNQVYMLLRAEEWQTAASVGRFAVANKDADGDFYPKILIINYAQSLKWSGDAAECLRLLGTVDWRASIREYRLGVAILREDYNNAATLMRQIGPEGEVLKKADYEVWPIFREFRKTPQFLEAYKDIYKTDFPASSPVSSQPIQYGRTAASAADSCDSNQGDPTMPSKPMDDEDQGGETTA